AARISGRAGNEHPLEPALAQDAGVGAAVQGHAAAQAEVGNLQLDAERTREIDQRILEDELHRSGHVRKPLPLLRLEVDRLPWLARRPERVEEPVRIGPAGGEVVVEVREVELDP